MHIRFLFYLLIIATFFACEADKKKTATSETIQQTEEAKVPQNITLNEKIAIIKRNFKTIEETLSSFEKKTLKEEGGGYSELIGYFDGENLVKIKDANLGEHGSLITSYYLKDGDLFFVFEQEFTEVSMRGPFTDTEKRFYIYDDELIRVLEKEKTFKSGTYDMSKVQNVDKTEAWKSKTNTVSNYVNAAKKLRKELVKKESVVGLEDGRWISTDEETTGIEIKNGKFFMFQKVGDKTVNTAYDYELDEKDGIEYIVLKNDNGNTTIYGLLEYSEETLVLSYLNRGSTLTYTKAK